MKSRSFFLSTFFLLLCILGMVGQVSAKDKGDRPGYDKWGNKDKHGCYNKHGEYQNVQGGCDLHFGGDER
jgi:hypothetical protein